MSGDAGVVPRRWPGRPMLALALCAAAACGESAAPGDADAGTRPDFRGGVVYEIFVRSFADSDGDGIGDLRGLTAKLDYLNDGDPATKTDLGVDAVWLMPIFPSPSYHGYDVTDYRDVNPQYGTLADLDALVAAAHQRGISVLIDMVLNHSSSQHPWFVDSASGAGSAKRDFYVWRDVAPIWPRPWDPGSNTWYPRNGAYYYALFSPGMPDFNLGNTAVEGELTDAMKFWLARGIDGFRLDAVRYFFESPSGDLSEQPETHAFLRRVRAALQAAAPKMVLVAEAWAQVEIQASYWGQGDEVQLAFSFDLAEALTKAAHDGDASAVINLLARSEAAFAGKDRGAEAPFLSNHDQPRIMRALDNDAGAARVAAAALMAMPGTPFVYYGEEIGMLGGAASADQNKRTPFRWTAAAPGHGFTSGTPWYPGNEPDGVDVATQQADPRSLWNLYRSLIATRRAEAALTGGDATRPAVEGGGAGVLALLRTPAAGRRVLFVGNFGTAATGPFTIDVAGRPAILLSEGLTGTPAAASGKLSFSDLSARGFVFVALT